MVNRDWERDVAFSGSILEGSTIRLVPLALGHLDALCDVGLEPRLWSATTLAVRTREEMEAYVRSALEAREAGTAFPFAIEHQASRAIIGTTRYHSLVPEHRRVEIGFTWIALPFQRTGVNTEAKYLLLRHAFEVLDCIRVELRADAENQVSRRALERIGAREEGMLRNYRITEHRGVRHLAVYSILDSEWPEVRAGLEDRLSRVG